MVEEAGRVKRPAPRTRRPLPFGEIELAPPELFLGSLSLLDIDAGSIPFNDVSPLVAQGHLVVKHPPIFPVSPSHAGFMFERLPVASAVRHFSTIAATSSA